MKRRIVYSLCAAMLCAVLCGCGNQGRGQDDMVVGTPIVPETTPLVTPMITPDPEDGYVEDEDGFIEEKETERDKTASGNMQNGKSTVSPSPEATSRP